MITGERIRTYRIRNKLTQVQLAKKVSVSSQVISNWEREYTSPSPTDISNLSRVLGVSADFLLGNTDNPTGTISKKKSNEHEEGKSSSLDEIGKLIREYGIEQFGFFDIEKWKNLSPEDIDEIRRHFEWVAQKAKERNEEK